jgi:type VI secretion system protein VasD
MTTSVTTRTVILGLALLCLSACASKEIQGDGVIDLTLQITVADDVNPDDSDRPSPVFVQVFELRNTGALKNSDYLEVYQDASAALGPDLLNATEIGPLFPGSQRTEKLRLSTSTTAVGFMGEFNKYKQMQTSQTVDLEPGTDRQVTIVIDGTGVHLR